MDFSNVRFGTPQEFSDVHIVLKDWFRKQQWPDASIAILVKQTLPVLALSIIYNYKKQKRSIDQDSFFNYLLLDEIKKSEYFEHHDDQNLVYAIYFLKNESVLIEKGLMLISDKIKKNIESIDYA